MFNEEYILKDIIICTIKSYYECDDNRSYKEDGLDDKLSDEVDYLEMLPNLMSNLKFLNCVYNNLFDSSFLSFHFNIKDLFKCLCAYFLSDGKNINSYTYYFLIDNDVDDVFDLFLDSPPFGCELIKNFCYGFFFNHTILTFDFDEVKKYNFNEKYYFLTDYLRTIVEKYFEEMLFVNFCTEEIEYKIVEALNGNLIDDNNDLKIIFENRVLLKKIIFSDVYEDICSSQKEFYGLYELDEPEQFVVDSIKENKCFLNHDDDINLWIVDYFISLLYNPIKMKYNRATLSNEDKKILSKVNPFSKFERNSY